MRRLKSFGADMTVGKGILTVRVEFTMKEKCTVLVILSANLQKAPHSENKRKMRPSKLLQVPEI